MQPCLSILSNVLHFSDDNEFRNLIVWLEDQKIRHYKIEDRAELRNTSTAAWAKAFEKVLYIYIQ